MVTLSKKNFKICIVGLGYVGLPLAARYSQKGFDVIGFDINKNRIEELKNNYDRNDDLDKKKLNTFTQKSFLTSNMDYARECNTFIVTVPTPINNDKTPDLIPIKSASKLIGKYLKKDSIVIYESTVYPGVTDEICTPILAAESNLVFNKDFYTGYSPERIVPGDKVNTIEKIKKIVSASNTKTLKKIAYLYSSIIEAGIHEAPSIKVAEAAKVTENIQRDVNIALINEMHQLYSYIGIDTNAVIDAAASKWNFMKLTPGLVGGHCISIDPYYLMHKSEMSGYKPNLMRTAREINDDMGDWVLKNFFDYAKRNNIQLTEINVTFFGYSFKENCSDTRNTKIKNIILSLYSKNIAVSLWDPLVSKSELDILENMGIRIFREEPEKLDLVFLCVAHDPIKRFLSKYTGPLYDFKNLHK